VLNAAFHPDAMRSLGTPLVELVQFLDALGSSGRHLNGRVTTKLAFGEITFQKRRVA
jgi:hypothetical protein